MMSHQKSRREEEDFPVRVFQLREVFSWEKKLRGKESSTMRDQVIHTKIQIVLSALRLTSNASLPTHSRIFCCLLVPACCLLLAKLCKKTLKVKV